MWRETENEYTHFFRRIQRLPAATLMMGYDKSIGGRCVEFQNSSLCFAFPPRQRLGNKTIGGNYSLQPHSPLYSYNWINHVRLVHLKHFVYRDRFVRLYKIKTIFQSYRFILTIRTPAFLFFAKSSVALDFPFPSPVCLSIGEIATRNAPIFVYTYLRYLRKNPNQLLVRIVSALRVLGYFVVGTWGRFSGTHGRGHSGRPVPACREKFANLADRKRSTFDSQFGLEKFEFVFRNVANTVPGE